MQLYIDGISVWAPGLVDWPQARQVLRGERQYQPTSASPPAPDVLHAAERRRAPATVKLAVHVAQAACSMAEANPASLPCVFASSHGDTEISDYMCAELAHPQPALSPTRFHNSVHNAASGYWTIAVGCMQPANAISAGVNSFGSGLLEAAALLSSDAGRVLLVAYDIAAPVAMLPLCPLPQSFAVALVLSRQPTAHSVAQLRIAADAVVDAGYAHGLPPFALDLMSANPAARSLPLLHALANDIATQVPLARVVWGVALCR
jgi:Beta-ketoacyl synthase, N-terminal domain